MELECVAYLDKVGDMVFGGQPHELDLLNHVDHLVLILKFWFSLTIESTMAECIMSADDKPYSKKVFDASPIFFIFA